MQNEEQNTPYDSVERDRLRHDPDSGSNETPDAMLQKEGLIDPGNEHHHSDSTDTQTQLRHDADAGGDATGTAGPEPGEGKNDAPDTSGEDG